MFHRQSTPPTTAFNYIPGSVGSVSDGTFYSQNASPAESVLTANTTPPRSPESRRASYAAHGRSRSATAVPRHARSGSAGSIDESVITRFGFPTYRNLPSYVTSSSAAQPSLITSLPTSYAEPQEASYTTTTTHDYNFTEFDAAPAVQYPFSTEVNFDSFQTLPTSSLLEYLTAPNPSPALVNRITNVPRGTNTHFWWDIRNLRSWTDFNISTITSLPSVLPLLEVPVTSSFLPEPQRQTVQPEHQSALHDVYTSYYATKVNAALKVAQGNTHMVMRPCKTVPGGRPQPDFVSAYPSDYEKTIYGDARGRVVGLVKCYDQWNTGMRGESPPKQHGCRYGFIMTEIELLCVRCGGPTNSQTPDPTTVNAQTGIPIFGYLETSAPIRLSTSSAYDPDTGAVQMTAGIALWYLHMLAKENPFEGMGTWRMEVGGPAALTRQNALDKDAWIPKPQLGEKREAKRVRGWVFPEEPLSKRECGRGKRKGN
ncbi:hypothetical protein N0V90_000470 [Kalmusia sp. IMI 367209]|nr:hypothetical protein N0V90_000470 [Kalmusia sp. IMI 367209]